MEGYGDRRRARRARAAAAGVLTALTVLTGCSTMPGAAPDPREQLAQRPTFEDAERGYLDLLAELKRILDERVPGLEWQSEGPAERSRGGCGRPFDRVDDAENANYSVGRGARGAVPDAQWQPTVDALRVPLSEQGFTQVTVLQDEPGAHEVSIGDPRTGARVVFGTKVGTILTLYGACFLREDRG